MENLINSYNALASCFQRISLEEVKTMNYDQHRSLCYNEKLNFITALKVIDMNLIIKERLEILHKRKLQEIENKKLFLDEFIKN